MQNDGKLYIPKKRYIMIQQRDVYSMGDVNRVKFWSYYHCNKWYHCTITKL